VLATSPVFPRVKFDCSIILRSFLPVLRRRFIWSSERIRAEVHIITQQQVRAKVEGRNPEGREIVGRASRPAPIVVPGGETKGGGEDCVGFIGLAGECYR